MPRARKGTQAPQAENAQTYGEAGAQLEAQKQMPLPAAGGLPTPQSGGGAPPPAPPTAAQGGGVAPPNPNAAAMEAAAGITAMPTPLSSPSMRPGEPVTAGMAQGAGAGPEALQSAVPRDQVAVNLEQIAAVTGDPHLASLARKAGSQVGMR